MENVEKSSLTAKIKNNIIDKHWAIAAVLIGTTVGFISAVICVYGHLVVFGFNIAFIVSPLIAGFVETFVARRKYGRSTGAISALLIFILINLVAWVFPKNPISLNIFTLGGLALMVQAAFPILVNYLLFVVFIGLLSYSIGILGSFINRLIDKVWRKPTIEAEELRKEIYESDESLGFKKLELLFSTTPDIEGKKITGYLGLLSGEALISTKNSKEGSSGLKKIAGRKIDYITELENARNMALKRLEEKAKELGASAILEVHINYTNIGGIKGNTILVTAIGNAVKY